MNPSVPKAPVSSEQSSAKAGSGAEHGPAQERDAHDRDQQQIRAPAEDLDVRHDRACNTTAKNRKAAAFATSIGVTALLGSACG